MILQLDPPLPMETSRGSGLAHFMIDYGPESHLMWVVFMDSDGACWTVPNPEVRMQANWSLQRRPEKKPGQPPSAIRFTPGAGLHPMHVAGQPTDGTPFRGDAPTGGHSLSGHALKGRSSGGEGANGQPRYDAAPGER